MTNSFPRLSAWVELPPCGYKVFELPTASRRPGEAYRDFSSVSDSGFGISSLKAQDGAEFLAAPIGLVAIERYQRHLGARHHQFRQEMGRPTLISSTVIEDGPVTRVTRQRARWQDSEIVLDIAQFAGLDFVELRFVIDWHEHEQMLKLEIPTALSQPKIYAKVPGEVLQRRTMAKRSPIRIGAAVQGKIGNGDYTVALLNNSTYSYDCLNGLFRTVLIRSAPFARHNPKPVPHNDNNAWQDQGRQERSFWLMGGRGAYAEFSLDRRAEELQTPAEYVGFRPPRNAAMGAILPGIYAGHVWVLAIKRAEGTQDHTILRLQERSGSATHATSSRAARSVSMDSSNQRRGREMLEDHAGKERPKRSPRSIAAGGIGSQRFTREV